MAINSRSIRNGVIIKFNDVVVDKQTVITESESWTPSHDNLFKKLIKQGGIFKINKMKVEVIPVEKVLNSKGEVDQKVPKGDPLARF